MKDLCKKIINIIDITKVIYSLFVVVFIIGNIGFLFQKENVIICSTLIIFVLSVVYCIKNIKNRVVLLIYLCCFFTFIMSQYITADNGVLFFIDTFPFEIRLHTVYCVFLSLTTLMIGNCVIEFILSKKKNEKEEKTDRYFIKNDINKVKKLSMFLFYIISVLAFITLFERVSFARNHGYLGYMAEFVSKIPFLIRYIAGSVYVVFYIFISTNPTKKELLLPSIIYLVYLLLSLLTGSRSTCVLGIINFTLALIVREYKIEKKEKIIDYKKIIIVCILIPISIFLLNIYNTTRNSVEATNKNFFQNINDFFANQGSSIAVISLQKQYEQDLSDKRYPYVFYSIVKEVESKYNSDIYSEFKDTDNIKERVYQINSLGTKISYYHYGDDIKKGYGLGSNYIAEAYADAGYIGVTIVNILFGIIICVFNKLLFKNWITSTVVLMTTISFMYVPREPTFNWLNSITAVNLWLIILGVYILTKRRKEDKIA